MNCARRAALLLAGLTVEDCHDVLQRLPQPWRRQIAPYLDELRALGAAPGYDWLNALDTEPIAVAAGQGDPAVETLAAADPELVGRLLAREPAPVVGALLAAHDWPWREDFLAACGTRRRAALDKKLQSASGVAAPVLEVLLGQLAQRVREADGSAGPRESFDALLDRHSEAAPEAKASGWRAAWAR